MRYQLDTPMGSFAVRDTSLGWRLRCALEGLLEPGQAVRCSRRTPEGAGDAGRAREPNPTPHRGPAG